MRGARFVRPILPLFMLLVLAPACHQSRAPGAPVPRAEFLVLAGDSIAWVHPDAEGTRYVARTAPMHLARVGDGFVELYVVDDDRSFYDATIVGQALYARDIATGDSVLVFADTVMAAFAERYARTHPGERMLDPDEDGSPEPRINATSALSLLGHVGPYLSYEYRATADVIGGDGWAVTWRGVADLRTGRRVSLRELFGAPEGARIIAQGERLLARAADSVSALHDAHGAALRDMDDVVFDSASYTLRADSTGAPVVVFALEGRGDSAAGALLELPPVPASPPAWWDAARDARPVARDSSRAEWRFREYSVIAVRDSAAAGARVYVADSAGDRWPAAHLPALAQRVYRLDAPPVDSATRRALDRAFDAAALYNENARIAMTAPPRSGHPVRESQHEMSELMMPQHANILGHVFGGVILSMMDRAAAVAAIRHARRTCVTVSVDRVDFREPIHLGDLVVMKASVNFVGRTSMEVGVRVEAENLLTGVRRHTNSCYLTFVAIDDDHRPVVVPPVVPETPIEVRRYAAAQERRRRRLEEREAERRYADD
ncbi:MAG TPA: acyl-CoA thioesterase [Gemmatimonadaceae bacterium]|nr:acyl-CoA thioesterase [Gemmatimonadaceae bacterium]